VFIWFTSYMQWTQVTLSGSPSKAIEDIAIQCIQNRFPPPPPGTRPIDGYPRSPVQHGGVGNASAYPSSLPQITSLDCVYTARSYPKKQDTINFYPDKSSSGRGKFKRHVFAYVYPKAPYDMQKM